jgi:hypothetical protein
MKNAFVYYYEFTDTDNVYIRFLENSIKLLLKNKISDPLDIFVLYVGGSDNLKNELSKIQHEFKINLVNIDDGLSHYKNFLWIANDIDIKNKHIRLYKHKFTNYKDILSLGYDNIVQIDADLLCYSNINYMFETIQNNTIYTIHVPNDQSLDLDYINKILYQRKENTVPIFSFLPEHNARYIHLKNVVNLLLDYNLDDFKNDILKFGYWPNGGLYLFSREIINNYFNLLSLINYLITKDDEIAVLLLACAKNIKIQSLDIDNSVSFDYIDFFNNLRAYKIFHPAGTNLKKAIVNSDLNLMRD